MGVPPAILVLIRLLVRIGNKVDLGAFMALQATPRHRGYCALVLALGVAGASSWSKPKPDHYRFILPSGYIGWVQIVFGIPHGPALPITEDRRALLIKIDDSGVAKTGNLWVHSPRPKDEFFYQLQDPGGREKLVPVPIDYLIDDGYNTHGGFGVNGTPDNSPGYSFFFFIGPPEVRDRVPHADVRKEPGFGKKREGPPIYPMPGRMPTP